MQELFIEVVAKFIRMLQLDVLEQWSMGPVFTSAIVLQTLEFALDVVCLPTRSFDHFFFVPGLAAAVFILAGPLLVFQ